MGPKRMRRLLDVDGAFAALTHLNGNLVAYAFLVIGPADGGGEISWVTQLVVHTDYRNKKVATRLLHAAWGLSDRFAWGLATANPYAVRALEAATRRSCDPAVTRRSCDPAVTEWVGAWSTPGFSSATTVLRKRWSESA
jgi:GNAT superfamily N-acetyltransferase